MKFCEGDRVRWVGSMPGGLGTVTRAFPADERLPDRFTVLWDDGLRSVFEQETVYVRLDPVTLITEASDDL